MNDQTTGRKPYCYHCGEANATEKSIVTVAYRPGRRPFKKGLRPHCSYCASSNTAASNIMLIIGSVIVLLISGRYIMIEWNYF